MGCGTGTAAVDMERVGVGRGVMEVAEAFVACVEYGEPRPG